MGLLLGQPDADQLKLNLSRVDRVFAYRTGVGAENLALFRALSSRGGVFSCLTMESISSCATAHRSPSLKLINMEIDGGERPLPLSKI